MNAKVVNLFDFVLSLLSEIYRLQILTPMNTRFYLLIILSLLLLADCNQTQKADSGLKSDMGVVEIGMPQDSLDSADYKDVTVTEKKTFPAELDKASLSSRIAIPLSSKNIDSKEAKILITNLELLGKLWGFLKYHHPEVGIGNYNWDNELFRILPEYMKVDGRAQRDEILLQWIKKYGEIPKCTTCKETPPDAVLKPDLSWVEQFGMSTVLKEKIKEVYRNRHQGEQFYVQLGSSGNAVFVNENSYQHQYEQSVNIGLRLLALYRYWNMIQYFFPYKHLTDKNWNEVLSEYIPKFILAETRLEYQLAVLLLTGEINDTHANFLGGDKIDSLRGDLGAPFEVQFIENKLVVTRYYKHDVQNVVGLSIGDVITHINGKEIESIIDSIKVYYPASNESVRMKNLANDLLRSTKNIMTIDYVSSDGVPQKTELTLYERRGLYTSKKNSMPRNKLIYNDNMLVINDIIGYIYLSGITNERVSSFKKEFKNTKGVIIDIRKYPMEDVLYSLGSYFVSEDIPFAKFTKANVDNPGEFTFKSTFSKLINYALEPNLQPEELYQGKLVVIVNENTQSHAEFTAMAYRAGKNTTIIGSQTSGADGNVSKVVLPDGLTTWFSGAGVYYPDGRETQRIGIVPDIEIKPTIQGIREGRDELLEKAIEIINVSRQHKVH